MSENNNFENYVDIRNFKVYETKPVVLVRESHGHLVNSRVLPDYLPSKKNMAM